MPPIVELPRRADAAALPDGGAKTAAPETIETKLDQLLTGEKPGGEKPQGETTELSETPEAKAERERQEAEAAGGEETPEAKAERERLETEAATSEAGTTATKNLEKRIKKLLDVVERQQTAIEEARAGAQPAAPTEVSQIFDERTLGKMEADNQDGLDRVEDMIAQLGTDEQGVAETLRALGADFKDANGQPDWTPTRMGRELRASRQRLKERLRQMPQQRERARGINAGRAAYSKFLQRPEVLKVAPFLADTDSEENAMCQELRRNPVMRNMAGGDYWSTAAIIGHRVLGPLFDAYSRNGNGKPAGAIGTSRPTTKPGALPRLGGARPATNLSGLKAAKAKYAAHPTDENLAAVLGGLGM